MEGGKWVGEESIHLTLGFRGGVNKMRCSVFNDASIEGIPKQGIYHKKPNCYN